MDGSVEATGSGLVLKRCPIAAVQTARNLQGWVSVPSMLLSVDFQPVVDSDGKWVCASYATVPPNSGFEKNP